MTAQGELTPMPDVWKVPFRVIGEAEISKVEVDRSRSSRWAMVWDWDGTADQLGPALPETMLALSANNEVLAATGSSPNSFPEKVLRAVGKEFRGEWLGEFFPGGAVVNNGASWLSPETRLGDVKTENVMGLRSVSRGSVELLAGLVMRGMLRNLDPQPDWVGFYPSSETLKTVEEPMAYTVMGENGAVARLRDIYPDLEVVGSEEELVQRMFDLGVEKISVISGAEQAPGRWMGQLDHDTVPDLRWALGDRARLYGLPQGVTKMSGVRSWQSRHGLSGVRLGIMGFGNDGNDWVLLNESDVAVVVNSSGEATQELLRDLRAEKTRGEVLLVEPEHLPQLARHLGS